MLKGLKNKKNMQDKTNHLVEQTTKRQRVRPTPGTFRMVSRLTHRGRCVCVCVCLCVCVCVCVLVGGAVGEGVTAHLFHPGSRYYS